MSIELLGQISIAVLGLSALLFQAWRARDAIGRRRATIKHDAEVVNLLPEDAKAREKLLEHIDSSVSELIQEETVRRRNWGGIRLSIFTIVTGAYLAYFSITAVMEGNWLMVAVFLGLGLFIASSGFTLGVRALPKRERSASDFEGKDLR